MFCYTFFHMSTKDTVLIIPPNDPEAVMIFMLAKAMGLSVIESLQPHGASLDKEKNMEKKIRSGGWKNIVIVEMPGPRTESRLRRMGVEVVIIDHHHYDHLDRAHDPKTKKLLPSSLEQFLKRFRIDDKKMCRLGFEPKFVRGIGIMDRGFVWALREEGYKESDMYRVLAYRQELMRPYLNQKTEAQKERITKEVWKQRTEWNGFTIVIGRGKTELRPRLSLLIALKVKKPIPLILFERGRGLVYVQESPYALALFRKFGGFTFGMDRNWGYQNTPGVSKVTLVDIKRFLKKEIEKKAKKT